MCPELNVAKYDRLSNRIYYFSLLTLGKEISNLFYIVIKRIKIYYFKLDMYMNKE